MKESLEVERKEELGDGLKGEERISLATGGRRSRTAALFPKRPLARGLLFAAALFVVAAAVIAWNYFSVRETTDDAQIDGHIAPISARVGGTVIAVNVKDNQPVEAGSLLFQIDPKDYQVALERARADHAEAEAKALAARTSVPITSTTTGSQLSASQANVLQAQAGVDAAQKEIDAARARLNLNGARLQEARANADKASKDLERMTALVAKDEVSRQQYDAAVAAADASRAAVDSAQAAVTEAESGVRRAESGLEQARARLERARADVRAAQTAPEQVTITRAQARSAEAKAQQTKAALDQAELNLQYTSVKAPIGGIVSKKTVEIGQVVQPGQPLMAIVPLEDVWVTANFKETELKKMRPGQPAIVSVDAYGGRTYRGHVDSIAAATGARFSLLPPENATGNYVKVVQRVPVKIVLDKGQDKEHLLRPGMSVEATVITR